MKKTHILFVLFIITMSIYLWMLFVNIPQLHNFSGGVAILDMIPFYDKQHIFSLFESLKTEGRDFYLHRQIPTDMLYVIFFGLTYHLIIRHFVKALNWQKYSFLAVFPIVGAIFDASENISIAMLLHNYPQMPSALPDLLPYFSLFKTIFVSIALLSFFTLGIAFVIRKRKNIY